MGEQGKRKADACPLGGGKRRAVAVEVVVEERDWTSLHGDIANHIAERLLDGEGGGVKEYMAFRAVCFRWRASTDSPRDPTLADRRFRPRGWIPICENIGLRPADAGWIAYIHAATGKVRRGMLPEAVRGHRIVGFTDGLVVLLDTRTAAIRVVHPFTRAIVHLPTLAIFFHTVLRLHPSFNMDSFIWMNAFVCAAAAARPASIAVVITFPDMPLVITAQPGNKSWSMLHTNLNLSTTLLFNGRLYGMTQGNNQLVQVYPGTNNPASPAAAAVVVAQVPNGISGCPTNCVYYLVETMPGMLLVLLHKNANKSATGFTLLAVDLRRGKLTPVTGLGGDKALFLGRDRCVSVSSKNLPSIIGNTIHFAMPGRNPVTEYSFDDSLFKKPATRSHNGVRPIRRPVRPYALADHLITYCHHREWTRGLMFHEFYYVPASYSTYAD